MNSFAAKSRRRTESGHIGGVQIRAVLMACTPRCLISWLGSRNAARSVDFMIDHGPSTNQ
jgi:hypothetical protein